MNAAARRRPLRHRLFAVLALIALSYASYRTLWGTPFTVGMLADRQQLIARLHDPEALTDLGLIDGSVLDWHSDQLSPISLAERDADYAREARFLAEIDGFNAQTLSPADRITFEVLRE